MPNVLQSKILILLLLGLLALAPVRAQKAGWMPDGGQLPVDMVAELQLVFDNCEPKKQPIIPSTPGLSLQFRGRSEQISSVNFSALSKKVIYTYAAQLEQKRAVRIPAFEIETDKGRLRVPEARFEPGEGRVGSYQVPVSKIAGAQLIPSSPTVWAGEVFGLTYQLQVNTDYRAELASNPEWTPDPVVIEEWGKGRKLPQQGSNDTHVRVAYQTRGYLREPGQYELKPVTQLLNVQTNAGTGLFGFFPQMEQLAITSDRPRLTVKPLPAPAPLGFTGAVGQFKLESKIVPERASVGEPITWTLSVTGTGNWPEFQGLPAREVSKTFQVIQPQSKRTMAEGKLFTGTLSEDVVLMPTQPGTYTLGEVRLVIFDPQTGAYQTLATPRTTLTIAAPANASQPSPTSPTPAPLGTDDTKKKPDKTASLIPTTEPPPPPAAIPGDPLPAGTPASAPLSAGPFRTLLCIPFVGLVFYWLSLALPRARINDPLAERRAAHMRLQATLDQLSRLAKIDAAQQSSSSTSTLDADSATTARHRLLAAWQRDTARLWNLPSAAPIADALLLAPAVPGSADAKSTASPSPAAERTASLWREADTALYGPDTPLSADWIDRALQSWNQTKPAGFSPISLLHPRNCMPWFFAIIAFLALGGNSLEAATNAANTKPHSERSGSTAPASPEVQYRRGDFDGACKGWEQTLRSNPLDWSSRTNLGLSLLQKGEAGAAVAHLAVAWVQQPRNPDVQRALHLALTRVDAAPAIIGPLQRSGPLNSLVRMASPREWQWLSAMAACLLAASVAIVLRSSFRENKRRSLHLAAIVCVVALLLGGVSATALHTYGDAADRKAVLVWSNSHLRSIPTEVDTTQESSALPAGTLAIVRRTFLGWLQLKFPSGQTGWVRKEDVVALWE